jgi:hypothetical protein
MDDPQRLKLTIVQQKHEIEDLRRTNEELVAKLEASTHAQTEQAQIIAQLMQGAPPRAVASNDEYVQELEFAYTCMKGQRNLYEGMFINERKLHDELQTRVAQVAPSLLVCSVPPELQGAKVKEAPPAHDDLDELPEPTFDDEELARQMQAEWAQEPLQNAAAIRTVLHDIF